MIYIAAGLFAEGRSDYNFLLPLLDRLLVNLGAKLFPAACEVADTRGIDAPAGMKGTRAERICEAISRHADYCELFVIHSDGGGNPEEVRETQISPGVQLAQSAYSKRKLNLIACVPVREIEAWMLVDPTPFRLVLGKSVEPALPAQPEAELDPKAILRKILRDGDARVNPQDTHRLFGENVRIDALRGLPAFRSFEAELVDALTLVAAAQGQRLTT